jgi:hypothetical protein
MFEGLLAILESEPILMQCPEVKNILEISTFVDAQNSH